MPKKNDVIVVGGGIVGLASALSIMKSKPGTRLTLIEKENGVARHQTGHNSGVIHSGLYYKPHSLKAVNCIAGYHQIINFCQEHSIPYDICGKVVVATSALELARLDELYHRGLANGLKGLRLLCPQEIQEIEPHCNGIRGLFVPQTGIVDFSLVASKYADLLINMGAEIILGESVIDIKNQNNRIPSLEYSKTQQPNESRPCCEDPN